MTTRDSVPSPYTVHVHPYPTRYHGGQWRRPVFGMPYVHHVQSHLRPVEFEDARGRKEVMLAGLGEVDDNGVTVETTGVTVEEAPPISPDAPWGGNNGLFRTHGEGGGIFNQALSGSSVSTGTLVAFGVGIAAGLGLWWYLKRK